ncbi:MAG: S9 family peptidase [Anaerolineae bacterium]|nr:S9 family peptidase [Anaerolineae bacterium]
MPKYKFEQFTATRLYGLVVAYSPDGQYIAHVHNGSGQFNLWLIPSGGGFPIQMTTFTDNTLRGAAWSPDGGYILFMADQNGDEQHQLYQIAASGSWPEALTNKLDAQHNITSEAFSPDGQWIAYCANDANPSNMDIILRHRDTGEMRRPMPPGKLYEPAAWSPDSRYLTVVDVRSNTDQDVLVLDVRSGEVVNATPHEGEVVFFPGPWKPDGSGFFLVSNSGREFNGIAFYDLARNAWDWFETPDHDVEQLVVSQSGRLVWALNEDGRSRLYGKDLATGAALRLPDLPLGVIGALDIRPDGERLAMTFTRPGEAANLFEYDLKTGELKRLGQSMLGGIHPEDLIEPELVHFPTFDGKMIPAWLYRPREGSPSGRYPVVLSIHGGPEAQERPTYAYNGFYQYLLSRGFGVLAPNIRGSSGYGISYQKLIHRDWGGAELKDIEHAAKYLHGLDWVDSNRIAVFGGSFGGFATLSAVTRLPEYWAAAVDLVGPSNLLTFVKSVPPFWQRFMKAWVGDPVDDHALLVERSPITYVDQVRTPLLVIQGAKDPRVVKAESDQMVERIRANGGEVQYYVDENEGHGATRRENAIKWWRMSAHFLEEHLLDEPAQA